MWLLRYRRFCDATSTVSRTNVRDRKEAVCNSVRRQDFAAEVDRRIKELKNKKHKKAKKAVKHLMNHLLHPSINLKPVKKGLNPPPSSPVKANQGQNEGQKNGFLLPPRRTIGHPSTISEAAFPAVTGRRNLQNTQNTQHYKRFHDYASFSSFSDTSSCIVRYYFYVFE